MDKQVAEIVVTYLDSENVRHKWSQVVLDPLDVTEFGISNLEQTLLMMTRGIVVKSTDLGIYSAIPASRILGIDAMLKFADVPDNLPL